MANSTKPKTTLNLVEDLLVCSYNRGKLLCSYDKARKEKKCYYVEVKNSRKTTPERFYLTQEESVGAEAIIDKYTKIHEEDRRRAREANTQKERDRRAVKKAMAEGVDNPLPEVSPLETKEDIEDKESEEHLIREAIEEKLVKSEEYLEDIEDLDETEPNESNEPDDEDNA